MDSIYKGICLSLIGSISRALEQMEERNYGTAEKLLREAWEAATRTSDDPPRTLLLK